MYNVYSLHITDKYTNNKYSWEIINFWFILTGLNTGLS